MAVTVTALKDSDGAAVTVQEGESCNVVVTFQDLAGATIVKANLITLTATLFDLRSSAAINSRSVQSVLDANGGAVATDGTLTLRLQPADNAIIGNVAAGDVQVHILEFVWTWSDGVLTRTGHSGPLGISVEKLSTAV